MTSFFSLNGKLYNRSDKIDNVKKINVGDPLCIEYKAFNIISDNFDRFGKSEIIIANHVKNTASKDRILQSITYYDDDARIIKKFGSSRGKYKIEKFDASEYGYPVCFYTPGYQGTVLNITTKIWEVDDRSKVSSVVKILSLGLAGVEKIYATPFIPLINEALGICSTIITNVNDHKELCDDHTIEFRVDSHNPSYSYTEPIYEGLYVCIPGYMDINKKKEIIRDYIVEDYGLYNIDNVNEGHYIEYPESYFIIQVVSIERKDLGDFDFTASATELVAKITNKSSNTEELTQQVLSMSKNAYDLGLIEILTNTYNKYLKTHSSDDKAQVIALYKQLSNSDKFSWFNSHFPDIVNLINN